MTNAPQLAASAIFAVTLGAMLADRVHRVIAAAFGAAAMMAAGYWLQFYTEEEAVAAIDFETLGLLLGMMILVRMLEQTGFFEYAAVVTARYSGGRPWLLLFLLGATTSILSMFLDNVTTVVLLAPATVLVAEILGLNPVPFLMVQAMLSNVSGIATLIGDPPNVLIGSAAGLSFAAFITHLGPIVLFVWLAAVLLIRWLFRSEITKPARDPSVLEHLQVDETIHDRAALHRLLLVLAGTIAMFFAHGALGISPAFVALSGAAVALLWLQPDVNEMLVGVEWGVLLFFAGLFVMVGGLDAAGVLHHLASAVVTVSQADPVVLSLAIIWGVAVLSAIVDNVPVTIAMIPIVHELVAAGTAGPVLWWALALGAGLGGNATIIGATANVVIVSVSERTRTPVTPRLWMRHGVPVTLVTLVVASLLFAVLVPR